MNFMRRFFYTVITVLLCGFLGVASAAVSYPKQEFRIAISNTNRNLSLRSTEKDAYVTSSKIQGVDGEKWTVNYISKGVFEIVCVQNGYALTNKDGYVVSSPNTNASNQRWQIIAVENDFEGYPLYYKIVCNSNSLLALSFVPKSNSFKVEEYGKGSYQKFKLNLDGLEGYGANAMTPSGEKAGTIGGLLGEVVYVSTDTELISALDSEDPKTVVVTADIDMKSHWHTRIRDYKTLVGAYGNHTLYDPWFRTNNEYGNDEPSDNIVIQNLKMVAKNEKNRIMINVWSSRQIWIDHIYFENQLSYDRTGNGQDEVGKFIWINTPYENYQDAKDRLRSPDYVTISYCHLYNRYWTVAYGTQNDELTRDRTTLLYNWWDKNVRRCPQLGNGSAHVLNNYFSAYGKSDNGSATSGIIGGDGSEMLSTANRFNGYTKSQALMMGGGSEPCRDDNSYLCESLNATPSKVSFSPKKSSSWTPETTNYGYSLLDAYNTKGTDVKDFCEKYTGDVTSNVGLHFITDKDFDSWVVKRIANFFLVDLEVGDSPVVVVIEPIQGTLFKDLLVKDEDNYEDWHIAENLSVGSVMFGDRTAVYQTLPSVLAGAEFVQTACDSKNLSANQASFSAADDITVFVILDSRVSTLPSWLTGWTKSDETVTNDRGVTFNLYKRAFSEGEKVTLGTNGQTSGCVNYAVAAVRTAVVESGVEDVQTPLRLVYDGVGYSILNNDGKVSSVEVLAVNGSVVERPACEAGQIPVCRNSKPGFYIVKLRLGENQEILKILNR